MAPVIHALEAEPWAEVCVLATAQHREMLDQALKLFRIVPDLDLDIMQSGQSLPALTSRLVARIDDVLAAEMPDLVIAQGDARGARQPHQGRRSGRQHLRYREYGHRCLARAGG